MRKSACFYILLDGHHIRRAKFLVQSHRPILWGNAEVWGFPGRPQSPTLREFHCECVRNMHFNSLTNGYLLRVHYFLDFGFPFLFPMVEVFFFALPLLLFSLFGNLIPLSDFVFLYCLPIGSSSAFFLFFGFLDTGSPL